MIRPPWQCENMGILTLTEAEGNSQLTIQTHRFAVNPFQHSLQAAWMSVCIFLVFLSITADRKNMLIYGAKRKTNIPTKFLKWCLKTFEHQLYLWIH